MTERVTNGSFETGDITGWSGRNASANSYYPAKDGTWSCLIYDNSGGELWQTIDLTDVNILSYWAKNESGAGADVLVKFDDVLVQTGSTGSSSWLYNEIDTSSYSGNIVVEFSVADDADLELDLISAATVEPWMQINIGDSWKSVTAMKINIGDAWKDVVSIKQNIGDMWKTVF